MHAGHIGVEQEGAAILRHGFVWLLAVFSAAGGMVQGYAIGLVEALSSSSTFHMAFPDLLQRHDATPTFVVVFVLGTAVGSLPLIAGAAAATLGRKRTIVIGAAIGVLAGIIMAATPEGNVRWLYSMRALSGVSVGMLSVSVPLYQSEIAPAHLRGKLMATFQLAVTLGIMCAFMTDYVLSRLPNDSPQCERYALCGQRWRLVLALQILPGLVLLVGIPLLPESPRWHMMCGDEVAAKRALINIRKANGLDVLQELHEMKTCARLSAPPHSLPAHRAPFPAALAVRRCEPPLLPPAHPHAQVCPASLLPRHRCRGRCGDRP